jgi:REP element-mobilizing transposase RayT
MSHSYVQNIIHLVFSTKERRRLISAEFQPALWAYVAGLCKKNEIFVHAVGGMDDHIHSLVQNSGDAGIGQGGPDDQVEFVAMDA